VLSVLGPRARTKRNHRYKYGTFGQEWERGTKINSRARFETSKQTLSFSPEGLSALSEGLDLKLTEGLHASRQRFENEIRSPSATRHKPAKLRLKSISSAKSARMQSLCMWESPQITQKRPVSYQRYASSPTRYVESSNVDTQQGPDVETHRQRLSLMIDYFTSALGITAQS